MQSNNIRNNNTNHVQSIHNPLMSGQNNQNDKKTTQLFSQLLKEFKLYYLVAIVMNLLLAALFYVQYISACNTKDLNIWMIYAAVIFSLQFIFYIMVILPSYNKPKTYYFAEQLHEVIFEGEEEYYFQLDKRQRRKMRKRIENLIKAHFKNYHKVFRFIDYLLTVCDLGLIILGLIYFSKNDYFKYMFSSQKSSTIKQDCEFADVWIIFWCMILLIISRKQVIQVAILLMIALPVLIFYIPIKWIKQDKNKKKINLNCLKVLNSIKYDPHIIQGDEHACTICRMDYVMGDSLKILPCSRLHHFHSSCIKAWFQISPTCPLCRKELGQIIEDIRSTNDANSYLIIEQMTHSFTNNNLEEDQRNDNNNNNNNNLNQNNQISMQ
ncbi:hypothetical protein ABPG72_008966 [Tetrahymena utriculariae]